MANRVLVDYDDLSLAVDWVSSDGFDNAAYVRRADGKIFLGGDPEVVDLPEPLPDNLEDETQFVVVPDRRDLDLGQALVFAFARSISAAFYDDVRDAFRRRGAWRAFRDLLDARGLTDAWHAFEDRETRAALTQWLHDEGFGVAGEAAAAHDIDDGEQATS
jgi:hypothetical protein